MRKMAALLVFVILAAAPAMAQTMHNLQTATVAWDPAPKPVCGNCQTPPCAWSEECPGIGPAVGAIYYQVYAKNNLVDMVGAKVGEPTQAPQLLVSFPIGVPTYIGVETIWWPAGGGPSRKSETKSWSNVAADCAGGVTFGFLYQLGLPPIPTPLRPGGLRLLP